MRKIWIVAAAAALLAGCGGEPAPAPAPMDARAKAIAINDQLMGCDRGDAAPAPEPSEIALGDGVTLLDTPCFFGPYQTSSRFFILREGDPEPELLTFLGYEEGVWSADTHAFNAEFDPATTTLSTWAKSAGHGGCGAQAKYRWDGYRFVLVEMRARGCDAPIDEADAVDYPVVWTNPRPPGQ